MLWYSVNFLRLAVFPRFFLKTQTPSSKSTVHLGPRNVAPRLSNQALRSLGLQKCLCILLAKDGHELNCKLKAVMNLAGLCNCGPHFMIVRFVDCPQTFYLFYLFILQWLIQFVRMVHGPHILMPKAIVRDLLKPHLSELRRHLKACLLSLLTLTTV